MTANALTNHSHSTHQGLNEFLSQGRILGGGKGLSCQPNSFLNRASLGVLKILSLQNR